MPQHQNTSLACFDPILSRPRLTEWMDTYLSRDYQALVPLAEGILNEVHIPHTYGELMLCEGVEGQGEGRGNREHRSMGHGRSKDEQLGWRRRSSQSAARLEQQAWTEARPSRLRSPQAEQEQSGVSRHASHQHSSSWSRRLGMPLRTGNGLPVSGQVSCPSSRCSSSRAW